MKSPAQNSPRILLVRFGAMGDIIHTLPAAAALRAAFPSARIDWLVETRWRALLEPGRNREGAVAGAGTTFDNVTSFNAQGSTTSDAATTSDNRSLSVAARLLDQIISLDTFALRRNFTSPSSWRTLRELIGQLRDNRYDIAVDLQGAIKSALACKLSGARSIHGFAAPWLREALAGILYTRRVQSSARHIVEANLDLAAAVIGSARQTDAPLKFPLPSGDACALPTEVSRGNFAVLNPGAGWRSKQWPTASFAAVCDALAAQHQMPAVLNCGPGERELAAAVQAECQVARPIIFSGEIPALIALLRRARLMVGPDTGPLHLAAALGVPTVGIYGPTDPARNGPRGPAVRTLRAAGARTSHRQDAPPDGSMASISPAMALAEIELLLAGQLRA